VRLDWSGVYVYGCRAYPLLVERVKNINRRAFKTKERAYLGYLVGYGGSNLYRIWVPLLDRVVVTRNVTFNEELFFGSKKEEREALNVGEIDRVVKYVSLTEGARKPLLVIDLINEFLTMSLSPDPLDEPEEGESQDSREPLEPSSGVELPGSPKDCESVDEPLTPTQGLMTPTSIDSLPE